jgi:hypothetical protein
LREFEKEESGFRNLGLGAASGYWCSFISQILIGRLKGNWEFGNMRSIRLLMFMYVQILHAVIIDLLFSPIY